MASARIFLAPALFLALPLSGCSESYTVKVTYGPNWRPVFTLYETNWRGREVVADGTCITYARVSNVDTEVKQWEFDTHKLTKTRCSASRIG